MQARRLLLIAAGLLLLSALLSSGAERKDQAGEADRPPPITTVQGTVVSGRLTGDESVTAKVGDRVEIDIIAETIDTATIEELGVEVEVSPQLPGRLLVVPGTVGSFDVILEDSGESMGKLIVEPAA